MTFTISRLVYVLRIANMSKNAILAEHILIEIFIRQVFKVNAIHLDQSA